MEDGLRLPVADRLTGQSNYRAWRSYVQPMLDAKDLWQYADPDDLASREPIATEEDAGSDKLKKEWSKGNKIARAWLISTLAPNIALMVSNYSTARQVWTFLDSQYEPEGMAQEYSAWQKFRDVHYDGKELPKFLEDYRLAVNDLETSHVQLEERIKVYNLIACVAPYFESFAANKREQFRQMRRKDKDKLPTLEDVMSDLLDEYRAQDEHLGASNTVAVARQRVTRISAGQDGREVVGGRVACPQCGKMGHGPDRCWQLHPELRPKRPQQGADGKGQESSAGAGDIRGDVRQHKILFASERVCEMALSARFATDSWVLDSGASVHITNDPDDLFDSTKCHEVVTIGRGEVVATRRGRCTKLVVAPDGGRTALTFSEVLYVEGMVAKLLSVQVLQDKGLFYRSDHQTLFFADGDVISAVRVVDGLPTLAAGPAPSRIPDATPVVRRPRGGSDRLPAALASSKSIHLPHASANTWHARLGHLSCDNLKRAIGATTGLVIKGEVEETFCGVCVAAHSKRKHTRVVRPRPCTPFEEVSVDVVTIRDKGIAGQKYFALFTDGSSLYRKVYILDVKAGAQASFRTFVDYVKTQTDISVRTVRIDNGREYGGHALHQFCDERGISLHTTTPHNSEQNGRAEVSNHIVCTVARKLLQGGRLPKHLWPEAVQTAVYLLNVIPSQSLDNKTPHTVLAEALNWDVKAPCVANLRAYGCVAYVHDDEVRRGDKFAPRAKPGRLVGYEGGTIYRVWMPHSGKIVRSTSVVFDEDAFAIGDEFEADMRLSMDDYLPLVREGDDTSGGESIDVEGPTPSVDPLPDFDEVQLQEEHIDTGLPELGSSGTYDEDSRSDQDGSSDSDVSENIVVARPLSPASAQTAESQTGLRRTGRAVIPTLKAREANALAKDSLPHSTPRKTFFALTAAINATENRVPRTFGEAMAAPQAEEWRKACQAEIDSLTENKVWRLVPPPTDGSTVIRGRWVFTIKTDVDGRPCRFKARWVARGFTQRPGIDYEETYAAVTRPLSLKVIMALVAHYDLECRQYDVITAFLNAVLRDRSIYVEQPHGFERGNKVCLLLKALYGLKQSPLLWYQEFARYLRAARFAPLWSDNCVFIQKETGAIVVIYVDDLLIVSRSGELVNTVAGALRRQFKMRELGDVAFFLGCRIVRDRTLRKLWLVQDGYIEQAARKHHLTDFARAGTPTDDSHKLQKAPPEYRATKNLKDRYQSLVGSLMWPAMQTRPDVAYVVGNLARYLNNPTPQHWKTALRVLQYLYTTRSFGICFTGSDTMNLGLKGFSDSSFADDPHDRRSTCGFVYLLAGGPICWKSGRQPIVALSTTEAEYIAMTFAAKEAAAVKRLLSELRYLGTDHYKITLHEDNLPAIDLLSRTCSDGRTRNIDVRFHYIRQQVEKGAIAIAKVKTSDQAADGLTKGLGRGKFERFRTQIGIVDCGTAIRLTRSKGQVTWG